MLSPAQGSRVSCEGPSVDRVATRTLLGRRSKGPAVSTVTTAPVPGRGAWEWRRGSERAGAFDGREGLGARSAYPAEGHARGLQYLSGSMIPSDPIAHDT